MDHEELIQLHDEEYLAGRRINYMTVATCECGRSWITVENGRHRFSRYEWEEMMRRHFSPSSNHYEEMEKKN
jgi:hypothetical protein